MKGQAKPSWTPGRHAWLRVLADGARRKPKGTGEGSVATYCKALGWAVVKPPLGYYLTPEGEATLARWEAGDFGLEAKPTRRGFIGAGLSPAQLAIKLLEAGEAPALAVYEALHTALFGEMPPHREVRRFHAGGQAKGPVLRDGEVAAILSSGQVMPRETMEAILRAGVRQGDLVGADPGLEVGGTRHGPLPARMRLCPIKVEAPAPVMREDAPTECTATPPASCPGAIPPAAAPFGFAPHLGLRVTPSGFSECLACRGSGRGRYGWQCTPCGGSGRIRRTVEP